MSDESQNVMNSSVEGCGKYPVNVWICLAIALITLVIFSRVLTDDFVMWDDDLIIINNPKFAAESIWWVFTDVDTMQRYNPATFLVWTLIYKSAGFNPTWFHFGNWLLHGLSAVVLYLVLRVILQISADNGGLDRLSPFSKELAAVSGALLWSLHPLRVEIVAWASIIGYCLATFFLLVAFLCYLKAHRSPQPRRYRLYMGLAVLCYMVSLLSSPMCITFFLVFLVVDFFCLNLVNFSSATGRWQAIRAVLLEKLLFALPALGISLAAVMIRYRPTPKWDQPPVPLSLFGVVDHAMQAFYIWAYYLWKPFYPVNLAPIYTTLISFDPYAPVFIVSTAALMGLSLVVFLQRKRWTFLLGVWLCYLVLQIPFLGFFEHPYFTVDRYSLLSSLCYSVLAALLIVWVTPLVRPWMICVSMATVLLGLAGMSYQQTKVWKNSETLFRHTLVTLGDDPYRIQILGRLATYYAQTGQTDKTIETLKKLLAIKPTSYKANSQLASIFCVSKRYAEALPYYQMLLYKQPDNPQAHYEYGVALANLKRQTEADQQFQIAESLKNRK